MRMMYMFLGACSCHQFRRDMFACKNEHAEIRKSKKKIHKSPK
jgi:hypothetical protein